MRWFYCGERCGRRHTSITCYLASLLSGPAHSTTATYNFTGYDILHLNKNETVQGLRSTSIHANSVFLNLVLALIVDAELGLCEFAG